MEKKMSKSRENTIDLFKEEKSIKKIINKKIITDNSPLEAPKDPNNSTVYNLYNLIASSKKSSKMAENLREGGYGWGHAKKELIEELVKSFASQREKFNHYINHPQVVEDVLQKGALKAKKVADTTLNRVRESLGYNS
jgi:tryptophanyl-tRNA synthetase